MAHDDHTPPSKAPENGSPPDPFQELERMFGGLLGDADPASESVETGIPAVPPFPEFSAGASENAAAETLKTGPSETGPSETGFSGTEALETEALETETSDLEAPAPEEVASEAIEEKAAEASTQATDSTPTNVSEPDAPATTPPAEESTPPAPDLEALVAALDESTPRAPEILTKSLSMAEERRVSGARKRHIVFSIAHTRYALEMGQVTEVGPVPAITPLPGVPPWLLGVTNLRGDILPVLDFHLFLGHPFQEIGDRHRMLVVRAEEPQVEVGLVVDRVIGVRAVQPSSVLPPTAPLEAAVEPFLLGVTEQDDRLLAILDGQRLLTSDELLRFTDSTPNSDFESSQDHGSSDASNEGASPSQ